MPKSYNHRRAENEYIEWKRRDEKIYDQEWHVEGNSQNNKRF